MAELASDRRFGREGKMFGVLVGRDPRGRDVHLRAFSGMLDGRPWAAGFAGPTRPGRLTEEAERSTLDALRRIQGELSEIDVGSLERRHATTKARFDREIAALVEDRIRQKRSRAELRRRGLPPERLAELDAISRREGGRIRALRRERREVLAPIEASLAERRRVREGLRRERRRRSRQLQHEMHASHGLVNFAGRHASLASLFPGGIPTGTGECCAPKLLHEAALRGVRPEGAVEFWWGPAPPGGGREHGRAYGPCPEKCAPLLGHLLCGHESPAPPIGILHEDDDLLVVNKPAGLLSVPGRGLARTDCVETRLALLRPGGFVRATHRLDEATSGVLVLARSARAHRLVSRAFADGRVEKEYRARLTGDVADDGGVVGLPLRADPGDRPRQVVDLVRGRPARTRYTVLARRGGATDVCLQPETGRTHQLRVHCASPLGLGAPILGDALYGRADDGGLWLHATRLVLPHPRTGDALEIVAAAPRELGGLAELRP